MISLYCRALAKRVDKKPLQQFKPPQLPVRIYNKTINIDQAHYTKYCEQVRWQQGKGLHPCYLQTLSLPLQMTCLLDKKSPFPLLGLVHIGNVITQYACEPRLPFELRVRFTGVRQHPKGWECDVCVIAYQNGRCVYEATSTYLTRVKASHVEPIKARASSLQQSAHKESVDKKICMIDVPENAGRRYARLSGDFNPIHLSHLTARAFGFKRAIAHGMWTLATCYSALAARLDLSKESVRLQAQFEKPVFLPAELQLCAEQKDEESAIPGCGFSLMSGDNVNCHISGELETLSAQSG